jgi:hypothetical protein
MSAPSEWISVTVQCLEKDASFYLLALGGSVLYPPRS